MPYNFILFYIHVYVHFSHIYYKNVVYHDTNNNDSKPSKFILRVFNKYVMCLSYEVV